MSGFGQSIREPEPAADVEDTGSKQEVVQAETGGKPEPAADVEDTGSKQEVVQAETRGEPEPAADVEDTGSKQEVVQAETRGKRLKTEDEKSSCQRCETHEREHKESLSEMETFYKEKVQEARSALKQKEDELKSFKERVAGDLAVSIKAGDTESMNNPVSKTKLIEMYDKLKLLQWPKIKDHLRSHDVNLKEVKALSQKMFEDATEEMEKKKKQIEGVFGLNKQSSGPTPQKVKEYRQLTFQNLQLALYHSSKEDLLQTPFLQHQGQLPQDVMTNIRRLASECYWLGCLMALSNPPLQLDWKNHAPGMDAWDIFPRDVRAASR